MRYSLILRNLYSPFILFALVAVFNANTYAYDSRSRMVIASDTIPEAGVVEKVPSDAKGAGAAMGLGFSSLFSLHLFFILALAFGLLYLPILFLGVALGLAAFILGVANLNKITLKPINKDKYIKKSARPMSIAGILLGVAGLVLGTVIIVLLHTAF